MKEQLIEDLVKLKDASGSSAFLVKRYSSWLKILNEGSSLTTDFRAFLYAKSSFVQNFDPEYSKFLYSLAET